MTRRDDIVAAVLALDRARYSVDGFTALAQDRRVAMEDAQRTFRAAEGCLANAMERLAQAEAALDALLSGTEQLSQDPNERIDSE